MVSKADAIMWGGVAEFFRGLQSRRGSVEGGVLPWIFRLWGPFTFLGFPKGGDGPPSPPPESATE